MNKLKIAGVFALCILCFLTLAQVAFALSVTVGVSKGDTFTYDTSYFWSSTDAGKAVPQDTLEANNTKEIQITITAVSGAIINATKTYRYENGTEQTVTGYVDIATGDNEEIGAFFFVSANLSVNDRVYPEGLYSNTINETMLKTYSGVQRETNVDSSAFYFEYNTTINGNPARRAITSQINYYFDRQIGVCVEQHEETVITDLDTGYKETVASSVKLKESNAWAEPEFPTIAVVTFLILLIFALAIILLRKKRSKALTPPS